VTAELNRDALLSQFAWVGGHADVWRWFDDADTLGMIAAALVDPFRGRATKVAGIEARAFILGTACAIELGVGFVPIRKGGGIFPGPKAVAETSADYRGGSQMLRLQRAALTDGDRVLLVDDWLETGSQAGRRAHPCRGVWSDLPRGCRNRRSTPAGSSHGPRARPYPPLEGAPRRRQLTRGLPGPRHLSLA
jgi:adenine phosphoribosyltransferase